MLDSSKRQTARPAEMKEEAYNRTLKARAFDVSRYLLPLATNTSLGQIVNARTLETQISRLLSDPHAEVRQLGERLRNAAAGSAWNVQGDSAEHSCSARLRALDPALGADCGSTADPRGKDRAHAGQVRRAQRLPARHRERIGPGRRRADEAMRPSNPRRSVDLVDDQPLEIDLATTLLYGAMPLLLSPDCAATSLRSKRRSRNEIIALGARHRGRHDELLRDFSAGQGFRFDILMDIGGFRDMHRHRRCVQILQPFTDAHGYEVPEGLAEAGLLAAIRRCHDPGT